MECAIHVATSLPDASNCRPRMSMRQMYQQSKRYWHQLPEVRQKVTQEKRRSEAATNRLRVKLYQKVCYHLPPQWSWSLFCKL